MSKPTARQEAIVAMLRDRGSARLADLAREFDVSAITVRRDVEALAGQRRVLRAHGEVRLPPARERGARRPGLGDLVVLCAPRRSAYLAEIAAGARDEAVRHGLRWSVHDVTQAGSVAAALRRAAAVPDVLGVLVTPRWRSLAELAAEESSGPPDGSGPAAADPPAVLVERFAPAGSALAELDAVRTDHGHGVRLALRHLHERGHRRVLLAARDDSPTARTIRAAFPRVLAELGMPQVSEPLLSAAGAAADPAASVPYLPDVVRTSRATALVAHSDVDALNLVGQLQAAGVRVPDDLSIVAYDDKISGLGDLELTMVAPPKQEVGRQALTLLLDRVERGGPVRHVQLLPRVVDRGSTRHR